MQTKINIERTYHYRPCDFVTTSMTRPLKTSPVVLLAVNNIVPRIVDNVNRFFTFMTPI